MYPAYPYTNHICSTLSSLCITCNAPLTLHALYLPCTCPHSLAMVHDSKQNRCPDEGRVMAAYLGRGLQLYEWSNCSASELRTFRICGGTECLIETDPANGIIKPSCFVRQFDLDYQCKAIHGDHATACSDPWYNSTVS